MLLRFVLLLTAIAVHQANAECCGTYWSQSGLGGSDCCGNGECNIFCCNCDRGCCVNDNPNNGACGGKRCPKRLKNGKIIDPTATKWTLKEAVEFTHTNTSYMQSIFKKYDKNRDGLLSSIEVDQYIA